MNNLEPIVEYIEYYGGKLMDILRIILLSIGSIVTIFLLAKLMGYRQLSQMSMYDYINGITIGSIAAEMATATTENWIEPLIAMSLYASFTIILSIVSDRSIKLRRIIEGKPYVLYDNGSIYFNLLKKAKLDIGELLMLCRVAGYFNLSEIETIVLEENGQLSILPKSEYRSLQPSDMKIKPSKEQLVANVVIDGQIMTKNLSYIKKNESWLLNQLKTHNVKDVKEVLLATYDCDENFCIYRKHTKDSKGDILV